MLNKLQIKLLQTAVKAAGLRGKNCEGRYHLLLGAYKQPNGRPVTSCKQLNNSQLEDMLAICEAHGWRMPGKLADFFRSKITVHYDVASFAQQEAIKNLAGDLGWDNRQLAGMLRRMTKDSVSSVTTLSPSQAYKITEALKVMFGRTRGKYYSNLREIQEDMEVATDGKKTCQVG